MSGPTRTFLDHEHKKNPWPTENSKAAPVPKPKSRRKKLDPIEDPDADITVDLVNRRLNADRHPATGRKISGKKASEMQYILMGNSMTRIMDGDRVAKDDIEQRLDNIDKLHKQEFPSTKSKGAGCGYRKDARRLGAQAPHVVRPRPADRLLKNRTRRSPIDLRRGAHCHDGPG